jgi:hypothetical protein
MAKEIKFEYISCKPVVNENTLSHIEDKLKSIEMRLNNYLREKSNEESREQP